jgi:hypothetical protein
MMCSSLIRRQSRHVGRPTFAAAASTLPGSDTVTATSRDPQSGHFMRLESIEIGKVLPRVQISEPTSSS